MSMAAPPVKPDDFKNVIPAANSSFCTKIQLVLIRFPTLVYKFFRWAMKDDGTVSDDFKSWFGITPGAGLSAPSGLTASDGTSTTTITVSATAPAGATKFDVYRSDKDDVTTAVLIAPDLANASYTDTPPTAGGKLWYYWMKAKNDTQSSAFSNGDSGYAGDIGSSSGLQDFIASPSGNTWTYPGVTTSAAEIHIWGAGGGGGGDYYGAWDLPDPANKYGGGGGGSGEYRVITGVTLTHNEVLQIFVGAGGAVGGSATNGTDGTKGDDSVMKRQDGTEMARAIGGGGGFKGNGSASAGAGGDGGSGGTGGSSTSGTPGVDGALGIVGGAGGAANSDTILGNSYEAGEGGHGRNSGTAGKKGRIVIKW